MYHHQNPLQCNRQTKNRVWTNVNPFHCHIQERKCIREYQKGPVTISTDTFPSSTYPCDKMKNPPSKSFTMQPPNQESSMDQCQPLPLPYTREKMHKRIPERASDHINGHVSFLLLTQVTKSQRLWENGIPTSSEGYLYLGMYSRYKSIKGVYIPFFFSP